MATIKPSTTSSTTKTTGMQSSSAMWGGVVFAIVFTFAIYALGNNLEPVRTTLAPDTGAAHYYWKLPNPTFWTHFSAWALYLTHQILWWGLVYYAQTKVRTYTPGLHRINIWALGMNAFFALVHLAQTHFFYDGLAQDVSIFSSQGSVIVLLVLVLILENKRRGMFFGRIAPISSEISNAVRHYHGYFFAWAICYTFWYHPTETTTGHLVGFFYTLLLMLQGSLFYTRIHTNKYWTFAQEFLVLAHGALVAVQQGGGLWPMFAFGFGGILLVTQLYGLGLARVWTNLISAVYVGLVLWVYSGRGWGKLNEVIRIPIIDYVLVFLLAGLVWLMLRAASVFKKPSSSPSD